MKNQDRSRTEIILYLSPLSPALSTPFNCPEFEIDRRKKGT